MKLVVDTNIVFSKLLRSDGVVGDTFFNSHPPLQLYAPEFLREEMAEHRADDEHYVALAIQLGAPLWTGDKKLLNGLRHKRFMLLVSTAEIPALIKPR